MRFTDNGISRIIDNIFFYNFVSSLHAFDGTENYNVFAKLIEMNLKVDISMNLLFYIWNIETKIRDDCQHNIT
jgi:hypothetical protein